MNWLKKLMASKPIIIKDCNKPINDIIDSSLYKVNIKKVTIKNIRINKENNE